MRVFWFCSCKKLYVCMVVFYFLDALVLVCVDVICVGHDPETGALGGGMSAV